MNILTMNFQEQQFKGGGGAGRETVCSFFNPVISLYIYNDLLVSMEMAAIFDFRALTKVHITSKSLLQMQ